MAQTLGYARVSTQDQDLSGQIDRLEQAGATRVFEGIISGQTFERPGLTAILDYARNGDTLAVTRLDRLGRSLKELLETVEELRNRGIGLISLEERTPPRTAQSRPRQGGCRPQTGESRPLTRPSGKTNRHRSFDALPDRRRAIAEVPASFMSAVTQRTNPEVRPYTHRRRQG